MFVAHIQISKLERYDQNHYTKEKHVARDEEHYENVFLESLYSVINLLPHSEAQIDSINVFHIKIVVGNRQQIILGKAKKHPKEMQSVYWMEFAARQGDVNSLYEIIENDPCVLEAIDSIPFVESPLHVAARAGQVEFAAEIMTLKPSFAWKFNPQGRRPIHLALENGDTRMVLHLIKMEKELVRAKRREGLTLLHLASESGDIHLLTEFLKACPDSVKDLTVRNETALHFAVTYRRLDTLRFLLRWLTTNTVELQPILNQKDVDGNTILHIAATNNDTEAMQLLMKNMTDLDAANLSGETAFDIIKDEEIKKNLGRAEARVKIIKKVRWLMVSMREWLIRKTGMRGKMSDEIRRVYMIVATLVATATYNAAVSPPGGVHQIQAAGTNNTAIHVESNSSKAFEGKSVMSSSDFMLFSITNSSAFIVSLISIIFMMPRNLGWVLLHTSASLFIFSYFLSLMVVSPNDITTKLSGTFLVVLFYSIGVVGGLFFTP